MSSPSEQDADTFDIADRVRELMPQLRRELGELVRIPSISVPGQIDKALLDASS